MSENAFYVYVYLDQRKSGEWTFKDKVFNFQPIYIGKGRLDRYKHHLRPFNLKDNSLKSRKINSIINETGKKPIHYKIYEGLTEEVSLSIESEMIKHFGIINN